MTRKGRRMIQNQVKHICDICIILFIGFCFTFDSKAKYLLHSRQLFPACTVWNAKNYLSCDKKYFVKSTVNSNFFLVSCFHEIFANKVLWESISVISTLWLVIMRICGVHPHRQVLCSLLTVTSSGNPHNRQKVQSVVRISWIAIEPWIEHPHLPIWQSRNLKSFMKPRRTECRNLRCIIEQF